jgi:surface protein
MLFTINTNFIEIPKVTMNANNISHIHEGADTANNRVMTVYFNDSSAYETLSFVTNRSGDGTRLVQILSNYLYQLSNIRTNVVDIEDINITSVVVDFEKLPLTDATFNQAITDILAEDPNGDYDLVPYGKIQDWDVSQVTDMRSAFQDKINFNGDISAWDTSSVTDMTLMFTRARAFNQSLNNWDVSSVISITFMFYEADVFDQPLSNWVFSTQLNDIQYMFTRCISFNKDLSSWDVSNITNMSRLFEGCSLYNQDLSGWVVSQVTSCGTFSSNTPSWVLPKPNFTNCTP